MSDAAEDSPHLNERQQRQAAESSTIGPIVIHEIVREQGQAEIARSFNGLAWSGFAAGASIGFSFLGEARLQAGLPDTPWRLLVASFGYSLGFLIVILGQQQLFTETTLTALIPTLTKRTLPTLIATLRVWAIVLSANLIGTWVFSAAAVYGGVFAPETDAALTHLADIAVGAPFWHTVVAGCFAGWLIGLMVWLLPAAGSARVLVIILLTYLVALCQLPHAIAGSAEAAYAVYIGHTDVLGYFTRFLIPTVLGNTFGGVVLVALLNHAPIAGELDGSASD